MAGWCADPDITWTPLPCCARSSPRRSPAAIARQPVGTCSAQIRWPEQPPGQVALGQQEPVVTGVPDQSPARLDEALLETGERPRIDPRWQDEPPPQIAQVVRQDAQLQPDFVGSEPVARQPRPVRGLLAFLDSLLGRAALVVKPHDRSIRDLEIRHDEADAREQLTHVMLDFCHDSPGRRLSAW